MRAIHGLRPRLFKFDTFGVGRKRDDAGFMGCVQGLDFCGVVQGRGVHRVHRVHTGRPAVRVFFAALARRALIWHTT